MGASAERHLFEALLEEYKAHRQEISDLNRESLRLTVPVGVGVLTAFGGTIALGPEYWWVYVIVSPVVLTQLLISLDMRFRVRAMSRRIASVERLVKALLDCTQVMAWESKYVPIIFDATQDAGGPNEVPAWRRWLVVFFMRLLRGIFLLPLGFVYLGCICMIVGRDGGPLRIAFPITALLALALGLFATWYVHVRVIGPRLTAIEEDMEVRFAELCERARKSADPYQKMVEGGNRA